MRKLFFEKLYKRMEINDNIFCLTGDLGFGLLDRIRDDFPDRFLNCGAAEQSLVDIAVGLALSGKIPFVYSITPFLLYRPFESIRNYLDREKIGVKLVSSGQDRDYLADGFSHWSNDAKAIMKNFKNIKCFYPKKKEELDKILRSCLEDKSPYFINLKR